MSGSRSRTLYDIRESGKKDLCDLNEIAEIAIY